MNIRRGGDLMGVDMLLIDCQLIYLTPILATMMPATRRWLVEEDTGVTPATPLLRGYAKVEALSIADLCHHSLSARCVSLLEQSDFQPMRVTEIKIDKWWCYVSCSNCGKKLQHTASSFTCVPCVVGVLRYVLPLSSIFTSITTQ
ncbi:unnamed protein product [Brassica rapa]|uniref:Uncharacterized protein n=1 Tax=Brassica campestris TaxID=3711 RepID=A0A8D9HS57_BRACM|nr:unnamed protein product [Brassica rapa]